MHGATMANPRRTSSSTMTENLSSLKQLFLKKPHYAIPTILSLLLLLTWISLRLQFPHFSSPPNHLLRKSYGGDLDRKSLVKFSSAFPSRVTKDKRGWLLDPVAVAFDAGIQGGAVNCGSIHAGEIRPGSLRGNHRHYTCNETFLIWGAKTIFRLENAGVSRGYGEVTVEADEVAVATSPHGTAHALINVDPAKSTFFIGCQDSVISYSNSTSDFNVWKDL